MVKYWCDLCNEWMIPVEGVNCIKQADYYYCAKHTAFEYIDGKPFVTEFPSPGRMIPETILTRVENIQKKQKRKISIACK